MSHECPDCGSTCFCNGDIDDCCLNEEATVNGCTHCHDENGTDPCEECNHTNCAICDFAQEERYK